MEIVEYECPCCGKIIKDTKYPGKKRSLNFEQHLRKHKLYNAKESF